MENFPDILPAGIRGQHLIRDPAGSDKSLRKNVQRFPTRHDGQNVAPVVKLQKGFNLQIDPGGIAGLRGADDDQPPGMLQRLTDMRRKRRAGGELPVIQENAADPALAFPVKKPPGENRLLKMLQLLLQPFCDCAVDRAVLITDKGVVLRICFCRGCFRRSSFCVACFCIGCLCVSCFLYGKAGRI